MSVQSSISVFGQVLANDARLTKLGACPGWFTTAYYRRRWQQRNGRNATPLSTKLVVNNEKVSISLTTAHLGAVLGLFVDSEYDLRQDLPSFRPKRILDLGANAGMGSAYLNAIYRNASFACVEPDPRNIPLLRKTLDLNEVSSIVIQAAIGPVAGELNLRFGDDPTCSALEDSPMHSLQHQVKVRVMSVPDVMDEAGWDQVDLVKMDIEGSEKELLSRNNDWLNKVGAIVLEIHPNTTPEEISGFLAPFGFEVTRLRAKSREPVFLAKRFETNA